MRPAPIVAAVSVLCSILACSGEPGSAPAPSGDSAITEADVYQHEHYWPSIVALTQEWVPPGAAAPLQAQWRGVLVRVEPEGQVRIDFGRHGRHELPLRYTDLVQRANETRLGTRTKLAQNFVLRVGNNLVNASSRPMRPHRFSEIAGASGYLCIFADPRAETFPELARALPALDGLNGVRTLFFPQSVSADDEEFVHDRLDALSWRVPYLYPRLSASYTASLLDEEPDRPRALLLSPEGRVLHEASLEAVAEFGALREAIRRLPAPEGPQGATS